MPNLPAIHPQPNGIRTWALLGSVFIEFPSEKAESSDADLRMLNNIFSSISFASPSFNALLQVHMMGLDINEVTGKQLIPSISGFLLMLFIKSHFL